MNLKLFGDTLHVARSELFSREFAFLFLRSHPIEGGRIERMVGGDVLMMAEPKDGERWEPTFRLSEEATQELLDQLWSMGLRPSAGDSSIGSDAAQKANLVDLRDTKQRLFSVIDKLLNAWSTR